MIKPLSAIFAAIALAALVIGCSDSTTATPTSGSGGGGSSSSRSYSGTASVGDFLTIGIDDATHTITYRNISTGAIGSVSFAVADDGSYDITDPSGTLVRAYEIPGFALVAQAGHTGASDQPSLVTAIMQQPITATTFAGNDYTYMQFRTNSGGLEVGHVSVGSDGGISLNSYWPYGVLSGQSVTESFRNDNGFPASAFTENAELNCLEVLPPGEVTPSYMFGTTGGFFAVDTDNGGIVGIREAASKDFDSANAGTYNAIVYQKADCNTGMGGVETGSVSMTRASMVISAGSGTAAANIILRNSSGDTILDSDLIPFEDSGLYAASGDDKVHNPCHGLFVFTTTEGNKVFVSFMPNALLFSMLQPGSGGSANNYTYRYGVALKWPGGSG